MARSKPKEGLTAQKQPSFSVRLRAKEQKAHRNARRMGFASVLDLDPRHKLNIEEVNRRMKTLKITANVEIVESVKNSMIKRRTSAKRLNLALGKIGSDSYLRLTKAQDVIGGAISSLSDDVLASTESPMIREHRSPYGSLCHVKVEQVDSAGGIYKRHSHFNDSIVNLTDMLATRQDFMNVDGDIRQASASESIEAQIFNVGERLPHG